MSDLTPLISNRPLSRISRPSLLWRAGSLFVATSIITGAIGSHLLLSASFTTAAHYAFLNGLGLCIVSLHPRFGTHRFAGPAIAVGGFIFSVTMMIVALSWGSLNGLAPVTPLGGILMAAGYISLAT